MASSDYSLRKVYCRFVKHLHLVIFYFFSSRFQQHFLVRQIEEVTRKCSVKKMFLKISQNSEGNTYAGVSVLLKLQASSRNSRFS